MKSGLLTAISSIAVAISATGANAITTMTSNNANGVSVRNIAVIQHSIMNNSMQIFEGSASPAMGSRANISSISADKKSASAPRPVPRKSSREVYGSEPMYGEYDEDHISVPMIENNGGDALGYTRPSVNNIWFNWRHFNDDAKFSDAQTVKSDYDIIMIGLTGDEKQMITGFSKWGLFSGYVGGTQNAGTMDIEEKGGYVGIYTGYNRGHFNLVASLDGGMLNNSSEYKYASDEYTNIWAGGGANITYGIELSQNLTLQPGLYAGYTWIKSANYISVSGAHIANKNMHAFEFTPILRAISRIGNGWFAFAHAQYMFNRTSGGNATVDGINLDDLKTKDFAEYGIGLEKSIDRFNLSVVLNRRDGGRRGWNGGVNLKYMF